MLIERAEIELHILINILSKKINSLLKLLLYTNLGLPVIILLITYIKAAQWIAGSSSVSGLRARFLLSELALPGAA